MRRRGYLAGLVGVGTLSGSLSRKTGRADRGNDVPLQDVTLPVPMEELDARLPRDAIPAITDPAFGTDWTDATSPEFADGPLELTPDAPVVGIERRGRARAYPLGILHWHEVVNEDFLGPLLVTYCPLCGSAVVAERRVGRDRRGGTVTQFGVTGKLWRANLVLYDAATNSLWSQILATAIHGPLAGERLRVRPSRLTTWGAWREAYPETQVLLPPPDSKTVTGREPVAIYDRLQFQEDSASLLGGDGQGPLTSRTLVIGIVTGDRARAYPFATIQRERVVNDVVAGRPVLVALAPGQTLVAYDRRVRGRWLDFEPVGDRFARAAGSRWRLTTGRAVDGPFEGVELSSSAARPPMFWHAWQSFYPDTDIYGRAAKTPQ